MSDPRAKRPPPRVVPCVQSTRAGCPLQAPVAWVRSIRVSCGCARPSVLLKAKPGGPARWYECLISLEALTERLRHWGSKVDLPAKRREPEGSL